MKAVITQSEKTMAEPKAKSKKMSPTDPVEEEEKAEVSGPRLTYSLVLLPVLVLDMIEILRPLVKYKYDTWRILLMKCYIDNSVHLWSCIRNVSIDKFAISKIIMDCP
jgi:hypothetical protein